MLEREGLELCLPCTVRPEDDGELGTEEGEAEGDMKTEEMGGGESRIGADGRDSREDVKTKAVLGEWDGLEEILVADAGKLGLQSSRLSFGGGGDFLFGCEDGRRAALSETE